MATKLGNLIANGGTYHTADGQEKVRWIRCGVALETDKGLRIKVESIPIGFDGWLSVMPDDKEYKPAAQAPEQGFRKDPAPKADEQSDIPF